ncbi:MAG: hypothetical protein FK734_01700 [Asgard group archaeon]|nr:hypothetical protein [Asgard group archaeon]
MASLTKKILSRKKGQLFLLEVFIALSVLILLMLAIYQVEFTTLPTYQDDLSTVGYNTLDSLNTAGELKPLVYNLLTDELAESLDDILPQNIVWRLKVDDGAGNTIFSLFWDRLPSTGASVGAADYFLYGYGDGLDQFRVIHLELWQLLG